MALWLMGLTVKFYGPTTYRGARWRVTSAAYDGAVLVPYQYELSHEEAILAAALEAVKAKGLGWYLTGELAQLPDGAYFVVAKVEGR